MSPDGPNFQETWLWQQAFVRDRSDYPADERSFFMEQYLSLRTRVKQLASRVAVDLPEMTVHDISHLDALWEMASLVTEGTVDVNPVESFVLGASFLLHDAAMTIGAYPNGVADVKSTTEWRDTIAAYALWADENGHDPIDPDDPPDIVVRKIMPKVLRRLHAQQAEVLATQAWMSPNEEQLYLIEDSELRSFYGPTIGQIAHSHWWPIDKLQDQFREDLGAHPSKTSNHTDRLKLACLLRVADALHLDSRRAPSFLYTITRPTGESSLHWNFQTRLARPYVESDAIVFTSGQPFSRGEAESWWLAYDKINIADQQLRDVNVLLHTLGKSTLKAKRIVGAGSPKILSRKIPTHGWRPIETRIRVSDALHIVKTLGGERLYGNDPVIAIRELIQNAADAIHARRKMQRREDDWGEITVSLTKREDRYWLAVEDNGVGMSSRVLTGPLLDFGMSFWRSPMALEEFPGLMASGMRSIGCFGIGFFAVFMLGSVVRVYSRRFDQGLKTGHLLEFHDGTWARPTISSSIDSNTLIDGGTRVEVLLNHSPHGPSGILSVGEYPWDELTLSRVVASVAPNLDVKINAKIDEERMSAIQTGDWLKIAGHELIERINYGDRRQIDNPELNCELMQVISDKNDTVYGRACINPLSYPGINNGGCITIDGLRATYLHNIDGILLGKSVTAVRDTALPIVPHEALAQWSSRQAQLIARSVQNEEHQANSAEVVLVCGGDVDDLKILRWGSKWLNATEFVSRISSRNEFFIGFDREFEYDQNVDNVVPRDFRDNFVQDENAIMVPKHHGWIVQVGRWNWPEAYPSSPDVGPSRLAKFVRDKIIYVWGSEFRVVDMEQEIGRVNDTKVLRNVQTFIRASTSIDQ